MVTAKPARPEPTLEKQIAAAEDWKHIGMALAIAAGALEAMLRTELLQREHKS